MGAELLAPTVPGSRRSCRPAMKMRFQLLPDDRGSVQAQGERQHLLSSDLLLFWWGSFARNLAAVFHFDLPIVSGLGPGPVLSLPIFRRVAHPPICLSVHTQSLAAWAVRALGLLGS